MTDTSNTPGPDLSSALDAQAVAVQFLRDQCAESSPLFVALDEAQDALSRAANIVGGVSS